MSQKRDPIEEGADLAAEEMVRRLKADPEGMPSHVLGKFVTDLNRIRDRRDEDEEVVKPFNLLDDLPTLPRERALELLDQEIWRLELEREKLLLARKEMTDAQSQDAREEAEGSVSRS